MSILFEWTQELSVGDETIDTQHRQLFDQTNKVLDMVIGQNPRPEEVSGVLDFLSQYIEQHFSFEEEYMRLHVYPELEKHIALHRSFLDRYVKIRKSIDPHLPTTESLIDLENFLGQWLVHHIGEEDKKYHIFIKERAIQ